MIIEFLKLVKNFMRRTENIFITTLEIFSFAEQNKITTQAAAMMIAQKNIDKRKKENASK